MSNKSSLIRATASNALVAIAACRAAGWRERDIARLGNKHVRAELALVPEALPVTASKAMRPLALAAQVAEVAYTAPKRPAKAPAARPRKSWKLTTASGSVYYALPLKRGGWLVNGTMSSGERVYQRGAELTLPEVGQRLVSRGTDKRVLRTSVCTKVEAPTA